MGKILGIDTGTNSIGWAIVTNEDDKFKLQDYGVNIFQEGVKIEKGIESSKAADRTDYRQARKKLFRRKLRKIGLLSILSDNHLCPPLSSDALHQWRNRHVYPADEAFMQWQRTEDKAGANPYHYRYLCLTRRLDLSDLTQRYILGRALYHINQRRGFKSNRKENTKASDGAVISGISDLSQQMADAGCKYLGEYFYQLYERGEKIRNHYTARDEHYLCEFHAIARMQQLDEELTAKLEKAIFYQRPLKSQKGTVGFCTFEKNKPRCPISHPLYEQYRMYCFINNIKMQTPRDAGLRYLTHEEKDRIIPLFYRKSKKSFPFEDIAKLMAGKNNYSYYKDKDTKPYRFNFYMDTTVSGCPVTAQLRDIFGDDWVGGAAEVYTLAVGKSRMQIMNDVWHALSFCSDDGHLRKFAVERLQLSDEQADKFIKISMSSDYAALSLKAIRKMMPYLRDYGMIYSKAAFLANLCEVIPAYEWGIEEMRKAAIEHVIEVIDSYDSSTDARTLEQCIKDYLRQRYGVDDQVLGRLYHPSMMDLYPRVKSNDNGLIQLGSPRISSFRNPMALRSLYRMRKLINRLLEEKKIDRDTEIHIEFARELNDANRRKALMDFQRQNERQNKEYRDKIIELTGNEPTKNDILKYRLWEEQNHQCLYTGNEIRVTDFIGDGSLYDIEHTIPQSVGGDSTTANMTLCDSRFNRDEKKTKLPSQLPGYEDILARIEPWRQRYEDLSAKIRKMRGVSTSDKDAKDQLIQRRHVLEMQRDYWRNKYERFLMTEVPDGFARRQGTDINVISRYTRLYLKSAFDKVYVIKGTITSDLRHLWGIQDDNTSKDRSLHTHHCVDAIVIACATLGEYAELVRHYHEDDNYKYFGIRKHESPKPWEGFAADIKNISDRILVYHYTDDNMSKHDRRYLRLSSGRKVLAQGDTARASLHNESNYGAIERDGEVKYVIRKSLDSIDDKDIKNIVDDTVRDIVAKAAEMHGGLKKALAADDVWMNRDKHIPIRKVRLFTPSVTRPLNIREQRDISRHEYKRQFHVTNDRNYMMAIYTGNDSRGREKREFELISNIAAAAYYKRSNPKTNPASLVVPEYSKSGYKLSYTLKIGTMLLLYENLPEEVRDCSKKELQLRLYKVIGISSMTIGNNSYGTISMVHHQDARPSSDIRYQNGAYHGGEVFRPGIKMLHTQLRALVEGTDFRLNELGDLKMIRND